jgi:hypothetical protein
VPDSQHRSNLCNLIVFAEIRRYCSSSMPSFEHRSNLCIVTDLVEDESIRCYRIDFQSALTEMACCCSDLLSVLVCLLMNVIRCCDDQKRAVYHHH